WVGYSILLLPVFFTSRWTAWKVAAAAFLCTPVWLVERLDQIGPRAQLVAESAYAIGVLVLLAGLWSARQIPAEAPAGEGLAMLVGAGVLKLRRTGNVSAG